MQRTDAKSSALVNFPGPLFYYDLVRAARRRWLWTARLTYVILVSICFMLFWLMALSGTGPEDVAFLFTPVAIGRATAARVANDFVMYFLSVQFSVAVLLTPLFVAGAVVEEKDRRRMPFLLTTDLHNREIVGGILLSRLFILLIVLLGGLPVLMLIQFLGGIDSDLLLAGFAFTALTVASLAGVSILMSVYSRRAVAATIASYLSAAFYIGLSWGACQAADRFPVACSVSFTDWPSAVTVADLVHWASTGNIFTAMARFDTGSSTLVDQLLGYAWFHGIVFLGCTAWAVARVRVVARRDAEGVGGRFRRPRETIPVGRHAMIWKEVSFPARLPRNLVFRIGTALLALTAVGPAGFAIGEFIYKGEYEWSELETRMNLLAGLGALVSAGLLVQVALHASACVATERSKRTLDGLLVTPLTPARILFAKWLACILRPRRALCWLGVLWLLAYLCGGLSLWSIPCLLVTWLVYASFAAGLGLCHSVTKRTALNASLWTLATMFVAVFGHWVAFIIYTDGMRDVRTLQNAEDFHRYCLTPFITLQVVAFSPNGWPGHAHGWPDSISEILAMRAGGPAINPLKVASGVGLYGVGTGVLWLAALWQFRRRSRPGTVRRRVPIPPDTEAIPIGPA